jgi:pimeloyl-ACP methyl ester carboxylesterase
LILIGTTLGTAIINGITTHYEVVGSGPPLLMYAPGGFDGTLEKWSTLGIYAKINVLNHLSQKYSCIVFDRRECGQSGGRVEPITWVHYADQGKALLRHLNIERAHLMGGCMGCSPVLTFAVTYPDSALSMILYWPVGGAKYRINNQRRFAEHLEYVQQHGLQGVVSLIAAEGKSFGADARVGPWASVIKNDTAFAEAFAGQDVEEYRRIVTGMRGALFDRDTAPGAEPEDMFQSRVPALIVPGRDASHATSAARYLEECLPNADYWDVSVADQTEEATNSRLLKFLEKVNPPDRAVRVQTDLPS